MARVAEVWHTRPSEMMGIGNKLRAYWFDHQMAVILSADRKVSAKTPKAKKTLDNLRRANPSVEEQIQMFKKRPKPVNYKSQGAIPPMTEDTRIERRGLRR